MPEPTTSEAVKMLRSMARGAGMGLVPGHNHDAMALEAGADALEQLQATRDRHAALEVHAAELHDLLNELWLRQPSNGHAPDLWPRIQAALQTPPPAVGQTILTEVANASAEVDDLRRHLAYVIEVTTPECEICEDEGEIIVDHNGEPKVVCQACADEIHRLSALDQAAPQEPNNG